MKIFVGNLNPGTKVEDVRQLFERHGKVSECDVIKQFAFVHMENEMEAYKAIAVLNDTWLKGGKIHVKLSHDGMVKIFVGNLRSSTSSENLRELFEHYGTVFDCDVVDGKYGFVHMDNEEAANNAIEALDDTELSGNRIRVTLSHGNKKTGGARVMGNNRREGDDIDRRRRGPSDGGSSGPVKLFVGNMTADVKPAELRSLFEKYGRVTECSVLDKYAFVHMEREPDAQDAIDNLHGIDFCGSRINVEFGRSNRRTQNDRYNNYSDRGSGSGGSRGGYVGGGYRRDYNGGGGRDMRGGGGGPMRRGDDMGGDRRGGPMETPGLLGYSAADALRSLPLESLGAAMNPWLNLQLSNLAGGPGNCCGVGHRHEHDDRREYSGSRSSGYDDRSGGSNNGSRHHPYARSNNRY